MRKIQLKGDAQDKITPTTRVQGVYFIFRRQFILKYYDQLFIYLKKTATFLTLPIYKQIKSQALSATYQTSECSLGGNLQRQIFDSSYVYRYWTQRHNGQITCENDLVDRLQFLTGGSDVMIYVQYYIHVYNINMLKYRYSK